MSRFSFEDHVSSNFIFGSELAVLKSKISTLIKKYQDWGALEVEIPTLLDSRVLLDLYGEDLRSRAFITIDPVDGEKILRPDFTVPIAEMHISSNKDVGKYAYAGRVWRSQPFGSKNPKEYYQVGLEYFHRSSAVTADAEIFALFLQSVDDFEIDIELSDMGILRSVVLDLEISEIKKNLLLRHLWRPERFQVLFRQLSRKNNASAIRRDFLGDMKSDQIKEHILSNGPIIGRRTVEEIEEGTKSLLAEDRSKPISGNIVKMVEKIQSMKCPLLDAFDRLSIFSSLGNKFVDACRNLGNRIETMKELGIDLENLRFATSLSQRSPEYYDGFIFSMVLRDYPGLPPIIQGGRYDALTKVLGKGKKVPAIGGIVRPELLIGLGKDRR